MRPILVLDTSLQGALIAVALPQSERGAWDILLSRHFESPQAAAASLPDLCSSILDGLKLSVKDLDGIVVGVGPGSFTGIKIGLSFVYGMKRAQPSLKLGEASALRGLATIQGPGQLWVLPATQTSGYFSENFGAETLLGVIEADLGGEFLLKASPRQSSGPWSRPIEVLGGWPKLRTFCESRDISFRDQAIGDNCQLLVRALIQDFVAKTSWLSEGLPEPLYLRKSAPEEKLEKAMLELP